MEACDILIKCGYHKPIQLLTCKDVKGLVAAVSLHSVILVVKGELDELIKGFSEAGVLDAMQAHLDLFKPLFVKPQKVLKAGESQT